MGDFHDSEFARLVLERGYATADRLEEAIREGQAARAAGKKISLGQILIRKRFLTIPEFVDVLGTLKSRPPASLDPESLLVVEAAAIESTRGDWSLALADLAGDAAGSAPQKIGQYEILAEIGRGGMGVVYRGRHVVLGHSVAIKVLQAAEAPDAQRAERFLREGRLLASLKHPNIVRIFDWGEEAGQTYFVMEFVEGRSLQARLATERLSVEEVVRFMIELAGTVQYAHEQGIVHRDLKPANILLEPQGTFKILDFGLAHIMGDRVPSLTESGVPLGTPHYMSPEQCRGIRRWIGPHSDVYSMGVILYQLLTGDLPFKDDSLFALLSKILSTDPLPPRQLSPQVPEALEEVCLTAMARNPESRPKSAADFALALERSLESKGPAGRPSRRLPRQGVDSGERRGCLAARSTAGLAVAILVPALLHLLGWLGF